MLEHLTEEEREQRVRLAIPLSRKTKCSAILYTRLIHDEIVKPIKINGQKAHRKKQKLVESQIELSGKDIESKKRRMSSATE